MNAIGAIVAAHTKAITAMIHLLGILSERDIVRAIGQGGVHALDDPASSHMTINVITITEDVTVLAAVERMNAGRFRHMPVLERDKLVGLISIGDVVKARIMEQEDEVDSLRAYVASSA